MGKRFTEVALQKLKPRANRYDVREGDGFLVRVFPSGEKSFQFVYQRYGIKKRVTLGPYPLLSLEKARSAHRHALELLVCGIDPADQKRVERDAAVKAAIDARSAVTVNELADRYLIWAKANRKSWKQIERVINKEVRPTIGRLKAAQATQDHIEAIIGSIEQRGSPIAANRALSIIGGMFTWACKDSKPKLLRINPASGIRKPVVEIARDRVLSEAEIRSFWIGLETAPISYLGKQSLRLALLTGQRIGEICGMRWDEIEGDWWTIPKERSKNKIAHRVPFCPVAKSIIEDLSEHRKGDTVFPNRRDSKRPMPPSTIPQKILAWLKDNEKRPTIKLEMGGTKPVEPFTPHDLRRTCATMLGGLGVSRFDQDRILNHSDTTMGGIYDRYRYDKEKRAALQKWEIKMLKIVGSNEKSKIVPLRVSRTAAV
jgi:integrase